MSQPDSNSPDSNLRFGIRVSMPADDPMSAPHLLGDDWQGERWYATAEDRDRALAKMEKQPPYYRKGDTPSVVLEKIER